MTQKIILASSSVYRKMLLSRLLIPFTTASPDIDETPMANEKPADLVRRLSISKAEAIGANYADALIIGSDQVAIHGSEIVGKPGNHEQAVAQLKSASGQSITLHTGLALLNTRSGHVQSSVVPFTVHFKELNKALIEAYLRKEKPYQCAGSLRAEGLGIALLKRFEGEDPNALIGLPLIALVEMLTAEKIDLFNQSTA